MNVFLFGFRIPEFFTPWSNVSSLAGATADLPCSVKNLGKFYTVWIILLSRGLQRDVVYLGWPIAPSYVSTNAGGGRGELRGLRKYVQLYTEPVFVNIIRSSGIDSRPGGIDSSESIPGLLKR
jgi:hypothetical protein